MKKLLLIVCIVVLVGCQKEVPKKTVKKVEKEEIVEVEEVDYIETDQLKALMIKTNGETRIVDLGVLHDLLSNALLINIDLTMDIDSQSDLIEEIVYDELIKWKRKIVKDVLEEEQIELNEDDFETLVFRTSINDAYNLMLSYETIFLKTQVE